VPLRPPGTKQARCPQTVAMVSSNSRPPLVTREALQAFTQRLVKQFAPEKVILFGSLARGQGRWDSDADILVVMPFEGRHFKRFARSVTRARQGFRWICCSGAQRKPRNVINKVILSSGKPLITVSASMAALSPLVWRCSTATKTRPPPPVFIVNNVLKNLLKAALLAEGVDIPKIHELIVLSALLSEADPSWHWDDQVLDALTTGAVASRYPGYAMTREDADQAIAATAELRHALLQQRGLAEA